MCRRSPVKNFLMRNDCSYLFSIRNYSTSGETPRRLADLLRSRKYFTFVVKKNHPVYLEVLTKLVIKPLGPVQYIIYVNDCVKRDTYRPILCNRQNPLNLLRLSSVLTLRYRNFNSKLLAIGHRMRQS